MEDFGRLLVREYSAYGELSKRQVESLNEHYDLLLRWNTRLNLTSLTSLLDAIRFHYCESLYLCRYLPKQRLKIVDVGSGAGFPGIPVAVSRPDCSIDLVESHRRKAVFLGEAVRKLGLLNVRVIPKRAEDIGGHYDWTVSRAVKMEDVLELNLSPNAAVL